MNVDLVVFDMDKTLLYPSTPFAQAFAQAFGFELGEHADAWARAVMIDGPCTGLEAVQAVFPDARPVEADLLCDRLATAWMECQTLYPGTIELLRAIRKSSNIRTAILTNGPSRFQRRIIEAFGLDRLVDFVFVSGDPLIGRRKPARACFRAVERATAVSPERCMMIGDSAEQDCAAAIAAGWRALWVNPAAEVGILGKRKVVADLVYLGQRAVTAPLRDSWLDYTGT